MPDLILKPEVLSDPLTRGYSGMTDEQVADDLNTIYRTHDVQSVSSADIYDAIDRAE